MKHRPSLIALALLALTFAGCSKHSSDAQFRQKLPGAWVQEDTKFAIVVASDGSFTSQRAYTDPNGEQVARMDGTLSVKDGFLINTIIHDSHSRSSDLPRIKRGRIFSIDDRKMIVRWDGADADFILNKNK